MQWLAYSYRAPAFILLSQIACWIAMRLIMNPAKWQLLEVESSLQEQQHFKKRFLFIWQRNLFSNMSHVGIWGIQWTTWQTASISEFSTQEAPEERATPFSSGERKEAALFCCQGSQNTGIRSEEEALHISFTNWASKCLSITSCTLSLSIEWIKNHHLL